MLTFHERINKYEYQLNDTDDQIVEYMLEHMEDIMTISIQALAENVYTVPNTIVRLSRKLGYEGFSHMKNAIKNEQNEGDQQGMDHLNKTRELIDLHKVKTINHLIMQSPRILIYGIGDSAIYCEYLMNGYRVANKKCEFNMHRHNTLSELETMSSKDLLILISVSGESPQIIEIARRAKERDIKMVSITDFRKNSLQRIVDHTLFFSSPPTFHHQHNVTDPTPIFYLLRRLLEGYWEAYM